MGRPDAPAEAESDPTSGSDEDEALVRVLDEYIADLEAGRPADAASLLAKHSSIAQRLRVCLSGLNLLGEAVPALAPTAPNLGPEFGDYRIIREVGRGGMGIVYEAVQISLDRRVALKILPFAAGLDPRQLQRFKHEALAASHLHHEHIVPVYAVGCEGGVHFYTMQFIEGTSLAGIAATQRSADDGAHVRAMAQFAWQAAEALDHAHQVGVVHRDIKPANLLVDNRGHLWVTDFGLASVQGGEGLTVSGDILGTLRYMSPEQASARRGVVDHRTDIYALGVTLYELLTSRPAFSGQDRQELLARLAQDEPTPPRRLNQAVPTELETVVLKAMAKAPEERYTTAKSLAEDLHRVLHGEPVQARRPGPLARLARWGRRNRRLVAAATALVLLAAIGLGVSTALIWQALRSAEKQRSLSEERELTGRRYLYSANMHMALDDWDQGHAARALGLLEAQRPAPNLEDLRGFEWYHLWGLCHRGLRATFSGHTGPVLAVAVAADGSVIASGGEDGTVRLWDPTTGRLRATLQAQGGEIKGLAVSPDGRRLAAACSDNTVRLWDLTTDNPPATLAGHAGIVMAVTFSRDGRTLVSCAADGTVRVWDGENGQSRAILKGHNGALTGVALSPNGSTLASGGHDKTVRLWDLTAPNPVPHTLGEHRSYVLCLAFAPDGRTLLSGSEDGVVQLWNVAGRTAWASLRRHTGAVASANFSADGQRVASVSWDGSLKVWDTDSGDVAFQLGHPGRAFAVAFVPGSQTLVTGCDDGAVRLWDANPPEEPLTLRGHVGSARSVAFSPSGGMLASGGADGTVRLWDWAKGREPLALGKHSDRVMAVVFTPDGARLISAAVDGTVRLWDPATRSDLGPFEQAGHHVWSLAISPDGKILAAAGYTDQTVTLWDIATQRKRATLTGHTDRVWGVDFSPDGRTVASTSNDRTVRLWDVATAQERGRIDLPEQWVFAVAFAPSGDALATGSGEGTVRLWDLATLTECVSFRGHPASVRCLAFLPDGKTLASGSDDCTVKLWGVATGQERATLRGPLFPVWSLAVSPNGKAVGVGAGDGAITIWRAASGPETEPK
jgi:WD40 repeat protein